MDRSTSWLRSTTLFSIKGSTLRVQLLGVEFVTWPAFLLFLVHFWLSISACVYVCVLCGAFAFVVEGWLGVVWSW